MRGFVFATLLCLTISAFAQTVHTPQLPAPGTRPTIDTIDTFRIVSLDEPQYPRLARQGHIQGTVVMGIQLAGCQAIPSSVRLISGNPMLAQVAVRSAQNSKYECQRGAYNATGQLYYDFKLDSKCHDDKTTSRIVDDNRVYVKACIAPPAP